MSSKSMLFRLTAPEKLIELHLKSRQLRKELQQAGSTGLAYATRSFLSIMKRRGAGRWPRKEISS